MTVFVCDECAYLVDIDDFNVPREDWHCPRCDSSSERLYEVPNFNEFIKELGYNYEPGTVRLKDERGTTPTVSLKVPRNVCSRTADAVLPLTRSNQ